MNGLHNLKVQADCLKSSNADVLVELTFENEEALKNLKSNEDYNVATKEAVVPFVASRTHVEFKKFKCSSNENCKKLHKINGFEVYILKCTSFFIIESEKR